MNLESLRQQVNAVFDDIAASINRYQPLAPRMLASDPKPTDPAAVAGAPLAPHDAALISQDVIAPALERIEFMVRQARENLSQSTELGHL